MEQDALEIVSVEVASLIPYARNARTHDDAQIAQIAASIREFGWTNPVLIDERDGIIAGHGRVLAARKLGMTEVPCICLSGLSESKRRAYVLADNKLALNAGWDMAMLATELAELDTGEFDMSLIGFSDEELEKIATFAPDYGNGLTDPDDTPETPVDPVTVVGDVWILGRHRLLCGDSTVATDVEKVLAGVKPHLMVTDPPYGVEYDAKHRRALQSANCKPAHGVVSNDDKADWREAWALFAGDVAYVWHAGNKAHIVAESLLACDFDIRAQIVWAKNKFVIGRGHYHGHHEPCWYAVRDRAGATGHWQGDRTQSTLWEVAHNKSETGHSTQKPVECMRRPIVNNSSAGQAVYEPFSGSGTTIIAAEQTGRSCLAIEISPAYVDVAVLRWQTFTGKQAIMESDGRSFDEVKSERQPQLEAA